MKNMRKLMALVLAVMMVMSLAVNAYAAEITISVVNSASGAPVAGHTYEVYQIFVGDVAKDGKTLSNAAFGKNYAPAGKDVTAAMEELAAMSSEEAAAAYLVANKSGEKFGTLDDKNGHKITAPTGYYLIIDVTEKLPENETRSAYILQALEDVAIKSKHTTGPNVEKKIDDENDSTTAEDAIEWQDSADHDIGDLIDFKITTTLPESFKLFVGKKAYPYTLHDTEEAGLTFQPGTVEVKIGDTTLTKDEHYSVVYPAKDGHTFDIVFDDLTTVPGAAAGAQIVVTYKSRLNEGAVIGNKGNVNQVFGEYKNFYDDEGPNYTPKDYVIAFTYKVNVDKIHKTGETEDGEPIFGELKGANFTLYKEVSQTAGAMTGAAIKAELAKTNPSIKADKLDDNKYYIVAGVKSGDATGSTFSFNGVDDGNYVLVETTIPDGYNAWDSVAFTISATHDDTWEGEERTTILTSLKGGDLVSGEFQDTGIIHTNIENKSGTELPETGGMGTTLFYIFGAILMVGAAVLLVTKKRMANAA